MNCNTLHIPRGSDKFWLFLTLLSLSNLKDWPTDNASVIIRRSINEVWDPRLMTFGGTWEQRPGTNPTDRPEIQNTKLGTLGYEGPETKNHLQDLKTNLKKHLPQRHLRPKIWDFWKKLSLMPAHKIWEVIWFQENLVKWKPRTGD